LNQKTIFSTIYFTRVYAISHKPFFYFFLLTFQNRNSLIIVEIEFFPVPRGLILAYNNHALFPQAPGILMKASEKLQRKCTLLLANIIGE